MAVNTSKTADKLKSKVSVIGEGAGKTVSPPAKPEDKKGGMMGLLEDMKVEIQKALPETMRSERMVRLALTAFRANPKMKEADPNTFLAAVMQSAQLGLEPNSPLGEAYMIPRKNHHTGRMEVTFQIGYRGILKMAHNTGQYHSIYAEAVYKEDKFEHELGLHKKLRHVPDDLPTGEPIYYYAVYHLTNGGYDFRVWSTKKIKLHAQRFSKALGKTSSPWRTNFDSMAKKTVLLDLLKFAPKSIELSNNLAMDNTVRANMEAEPERVIIDMEDSPEIQDSGQEQSFDPFGPEPPEQESYPDYNY